MKKSIIMMLVMLMVISISFIVGFGVTTFMVVNTLVPQLAILPPLPEDFFEEPEEEVQEEEIITFEDLHEPSMDNLNRLARELQKWQEDLQRKQFELLQMDQVLLERENIIAVENEALARQKEKLQKLKDELESLIIVIDTNEQNNFRDLAKLYDAMKIGQAMQMMRQLPDEQIMQMMMIMNTKRTAKLIETWLKDYPDDLPRLTKLTDDMRRIVKKPNEDEGVQ